jgi:hypothetical protein
MQRKSLAEIFPAPALLPGPRPSYLQMLEKNSAKWGTILHFFKSFIFTAFIDKINSNFTWIKILF